MARLSINRFFFILGWIKLILGLSILVIGITVNSLLPQEENIYGMHIRFLGTPIWNGLMILLGGSISVMIGTRKCSSSYLNRGNIFYDSMLALVLTAALPFYVLNTVSWRGCLHRRVSKEECGNFDQDVIWNGYTFYVLISSLVGTVIFVLLLSNSLLCNIEWCSGSSNHDMDRELCINDILDEIEDVNDTLDGFTTDDKLHDSGCDDQETDRESDSRTRNASQQTTKHFLKAGTKSAVIKTMSTSLPTLSDNAVSSSTFVVQSSSSASSLTSVQNRMWRS